jgi:hypothetical protein
MILSMGAGWFLSGPSARERLGACRWLKACLAENEPHEKQKKCMGQRRKAISLSAGMSPAAGDVAAAGHAGADSCEWGKLN